MNNASMQQFIEREEFGMNADDRKQLPRLIIALDHAVATYHREMFTKLENLYDWLNPSSSGYRLTADLKKDEEKMSKEEKWAMQETKMMDFIDLVEEFLNLAAFHHLPESIVRALLAKHNVEEGILVSLKGEK